jgi:DNA-binding transcriptional regulator WhiA
MINKDTFSRNVKEDLSNKDIGSKAQAFWEAYALRKFLSKAGDGARSTLWAEPYLMRRLLRLSRSTESSALLRTHASLRRRGRSGVKVPAMAIDPNPHQPPTELLLKHSFLRRAYLRGCFLAKGSVLSPLKGHHLEIAVGERKDAVFIQALLNQEGLKSGIVQRRTSFIVYMKDADDICEFLKIVGSSRAVLEYENIRAAKSLRNSVQRMVNMDRANVARSVEASLRQIRDIKLIEKTIGLKSLPKALRTLAEKRMDNPEMSMGELGQLLVPPCSKSAVNHRFRRIASIASKIRESQ